MTFIRIFARALHGSNSKQGQLVSFAPQVSSEFLFALVEELGSIAPEENGQPSAILITKRSVPDHLQRFSVTNELEAAAFRVEAPETCKRYFLSEGFDLATMYTVAPLLLPAEFPAVASAEFGMENLANEIAGFVQDQVGSSISLNHSSLVSKLLVSLKISAEVFRLGSSRLDVPWNVAWLAFAERAIDSLLSSLPTTTSADHVESLASLVFGLPSSGHPASWHRDSKRAAGDLSKAFDAFWSSADEIDRSADFLRTRYGSGGSTRLLLKFSGSRFEGQAMLTDATLVSCIQAISQLACDEAGSAQAFPAADFLSPRSQDEKLGTLSVTLTDGDLIGFGRSDAAQPFLVGVSNSGESLEVLIRLPMIEEYFSASTLIGEISMATSCSGVKFLATSIGQSDGDLVLIGVFELDGDAVEELDQNCFLACVLSYDLAPNSNLVGHVASTSRCNLILARNWGKEYLILDDPASKSLSKIEAWEFDPVSQEVEIGGSQKSTAVFVFGSGAQFEGVSMESFGFDRGHKTVSNVGKRMAVTTSDAVINLFTSAELNEHQSPILAAAYKENLSISSPGIANRLSIRGRLEELVSSEIENADFLHNNFHVALAESVPMIPESLSGEYLPGVVTGLAVARMLSDIPFAISAEFLASDEVRAFREAFLKLDVAGNLRSKLDGSFEWPSKVSWNNLFRHREALNDLLAAFQAMLKASEAYGQATKFWAAYPFSASVWSMDEQSCSAVLLSPLHPIRLAWLASVEHGLWETPEAQNFIGVIEGWNFPYLGPGIFSDSSMVAIPTDLGDESLFAGWSMLVPVPGGQPSPIIGPPTAATLPAPGSSATGFNASTARSALSAFRKINSHLNDFVIDLGISQSKSSPRLAEVDLAILDEAEKLLSSSDLYGGVHIYDSSKRTGLPPYQRLSEVAGKSYPKPFSWSVYEDIPSLQVRSHVKMLQDPGIKIQISKTNAYPTANLPEIPYRRFLGVPAFPSNAGETIMVPRLSLEAVTWQEFSAALSVLEGFAYGDQISASLQLSAIVGGDSDWTVSGEGMIGPAAIMSLLSASNAKDSMLWEWRPPFLDTKSLSQELSRRPYFAIAKIPSSFKSQISNKVQKALPAEDEAPDEIATKALKILGGRGMGLSGLLSMGSTHTTGALGFFAAFDLLDQVILPEGKGLLVLPVDACEPFIETLSGQKSTQLNKRADLLAIVFGEDSATLIPIEVKLIGLDAQSSVQPTLPTAQSAALDEAKGQVANTSKFLLEVVNQSQKHLSGNANIDSTLWRTNLATLLDAGSKLTKLSKSNSLTLSKLIGRVLNGVATLEVGGSVITYFHAASTNGAGASWTASSLEPGENERANFVLVCSIGTALSQNDDKSALYTDWNILFESAMSSESNRELEGEGQPTAIPSVGKPSRNEFDDESADLKPQSDKEDGTQDIDEDFKPENDEEKEPRHNDSVSKPEDYADPDHAISTETSGGYVSAVGKGQQGQTIYWRPSSIEQGLMLGVIGQPGMGKTQLLLSVMQDLAELKNSDGTSTALFVFDFKAEFSTMEEFNELYGFSVVNVLDSVPFDIWALPEDSKNDLKLGQRIIQICETFQSIYNIGANQQFRLSKVLEDQYKKRNFGSPSLTDIAEGYAKARDGAAPDTVDSILNQFKLTGAFLPDSAMPEVPSMQDYLRSGRKIFNFQLDQIASPQIIRFYATVILNEYRQLMMSQPNETNFPDDLRRLRSILIVDEAQNLMQHRPKSLSTIQSMGRSKGYGLVLASQQLSHFRPDPGVNFANLMDTWAFFRSAGLTKADLNGVGASPDTSQKLLAAINELGQGQAAFLSPTDKYGDWGSAEQYWRRKAHVD
jgi:hypothetical protein